MSADRFEHEELAEIADLENRASKLTRRSMLDAGKKAAFVIPALVAVTVPRSALGQTGSGWNGQKKRPKTKAKKKATKG